MSGDRGSLLIHERRSYLSGNQLWSKSSVEAYKNVLERGCRCIEIDVWDGEGSAAAQSSENEGDGKHEGLLTKGLHKLHLGKKKIEVEAEKSYSPSGDSMSMPAPWRSNSGRIEPRVLHGHTATKEVSFREVCEVIRDHAFHASDQPLIVSLEVHCNVAQQEIMAEIMTEYWKPYLVPTPEDFSNDTPLPTLASLRRRILIKVKYTEPSKEPEKEASNAGGEQDPDTDHAQVEPHGKKGNICYALGSMGVYTRSCHFHSLNQPEAQMPTHVFALPESKVLFLLQEQREALLRHNASFLMRAYPKIPFRLNWQAADAAMMLNDAMFEGTEGWVLKPASYHDDRRTPVKPKTLNLTVRLLAAQNVDSSKSSAPNVYIKCQLHVESRLEKREGQIPNEGKSKGGEWKRQSSHRQSHDPDFGGEELSFMGVEDVVPELSFMRFKAMDDISYQKDRTLGWTCFRIDRFPSGLQLLPLKGADAKPNGSALLVDIKLNLEAS
ncbi:hypothetical protein LTR82_016478 [Friedmanniomyces endolithicus]|uniref:PI-PLC Y-box domain-containing protein n=1 Tax=Friedmanniomyces endolithicus TaxID=329885 RepID=A0AAN6F7I2_9PEZI|nr:hypothetical protein LTR82_016478 [Friedmanniomyces endolithicus]